MARLSRRHLEQHVADWIAAWNRRDLEAVIAPFHEDAVFVSPRAAIVTGSATVRGRVALLAYWQVALAAVPDLAFALDRVVCDEDAQMLVVHYVATAAGRRLLASELMCFDDGQQIYGEALYGATIEATP